MFYYYTRIYFLAHFQYSIGELDTLFSIINSCLYIYIYIYIYVTVFWKTDHVVTNTEIHFLPVDESYTHALSRDIKHLSLDGQVCFCRRLFSNDVKPQGCISWPVWPLRGINKTALGAKLILMADSVYQVSCARLGHPLMAQHCHFCLNVCFNLPTAPHPPPIDSIRVITVIQKNCLKNQGCSNGLWN